MGILEMFFFLSLFVVVYFSVEISSWKKVNDSKRGGTDDVVERHELALVLVHEGPDHALEDHVASSED